MPNQGFYWQTPRDSALTDVAIQLFQIAAAYDKKPFDEAKKAIDEEYELIRGPSQRHGGKFQTAVQAYQEVGWVDTADGNLRITPAGHQAIALLTLAPDYLKAVPHYLVELLARYQLNNPARPPIKNAAIGTLRATSDIFPYWTIWKIMRSCDNMVTSDELRRFVFLLHRNDQVPEAIQSIMAFRKDQSALTQTELDAKYPTPITGANSDTKYWMGRAGAQIGRTPPLIEKPGQSTYQLNEGYLQLIDSILKEEPVFRENLSAQTWMQHYGRPVAIEGNESADAGIRPLIEEDDPVAYQVEQLFNSGVRSFLLTGPPGTSKSWYARQIAYRILGGDTSRLRLVQFHPSYGYEDFIEGFVPESAASGGLPSFTLKEKVFAEVCELARDGTCAVLIIDEFSRGDAGRIFGEALTYIEPDYRGTRFQLASGRDFSVPANVIIIATMNPYDRSVTAVDVAMQRRFSILRMAPSETILRSVLTTNSVSAGLVDRVVTFFQECQRVMPHGGLGHAYFLTTKDLDSLQLAWEHQLLPLFEQELRFEPDALEQIKQAFTDLNA